MLELLANVTIHGGILPLPIGFESLHIASRLPMDPPSHMQRKFLEYSRIGFGCSINLSNQMFIPQSRVANLNITWAKAIDMNRR